MEPQDRSEWIQQKKLIWKKLSPLGYEIISLCCIPGPNSFNAPVAARDHFERVNYKLYKNIWALKSQRHR